MKCWVIWMLRPRREERTMVYVIDLTGDDDVQAPPPAKRRRHGPNVKIEDACFSFGVAKTGSVPQGGTRLAHVVIDLCDDAPAVAAIGKSSCKVNTGCGRGTAVQHSKSMNSRRQTHAEPSSVPTPPAAAALPTPVPAHAPSVPRARNIPVTSSKQLLITAFARPNVRSQAQPAGSPSPHPPATTAANRTGRQGSAAGAAPDRREAATAAVHSTAQTPLGSGVVRASGSTTGATCPGMKRPPSASAEARGGTAGGSRPANLGGSGNGGEGGTADAGVAGGTSGNRVPENGRARARQPPGSGAGGAARGERAKTRHATWRRLHSQDRDLDARNDLGGLDRDSSLRFLDVMQQHNVTLEDIQDGAQAARDAVQHHKLSGIVLEASSRLERMDQRTPEDLVRVLRVAFPLVPGRASDRGINWTRLNSLAAKLFHPARGASVMLGPMNTQPKQRKAAAQRRKPEQVAAVTRPEEYEAGQDDSQKDSFTVHVMEEVLQRLRKVRSDAVAAAAAGEGSAAAADVTMVDMPTGLRLPATAFRPFVEVILDHSGFAQTVENNHAVGHLLAQSLLLAHINENGQLSLAALTAEEHKASKKAAQRVRPAPPTAASRHQAPGCTATAATAATAATVTTVTTTNLQQHVHFVIPLEMSDWPVMCEHVPRECCLMPSRSYSEDGAMIESAPRRRAGAAVGP
ncbi:hypothetical protein Vretimale_3560, partial [Volvox reticuliferus]